MFVCVCVIDMNTCVLYCSLLICPFGFPVVCDWIDVQLEAFAIFFVEYFSTVSICLLSL